MNTNFTFPRAQAPIPRPKPAAVSTNASASEPLNRESNALRASVLDAALQLGIGSNSLVADWMFNNPLKEEDEEDIASPSLTYGSSATSEESISSAGRFPYSPSSIPSSSRTVHPYAPDYGALSFPSDIPSEAVEGGITPPNNSEAMIKLNDAGSNMTFPLIPIPPRPTTPSGRKLRKKRADGYESDGGYISETGKKKDKKEKTKKVEDVGGDGELSKKEAKARAKEEEKEERKRKKSLVSAMKTSKKSDIKDVGYETDSAGGSFGKSMLGKGKPKKIKSKTESADTGYESDGGYLSTTPGNVKKSKTRFFKIGSKASKPDLRQEASFASEPIIEKEKEFIPLPIAERFATTLSAPSGTATGSFDMPSSRAPTPSPPMPSSMPPSPLPPVLPSIATSSLMPSMLPPVSTSSPVQRSPVTSSPSPKEHPVERDSNISAESTSSSSSHAKRRGLHFPTFRDINHGSGEGSHSTITSFQSSPSQASSSPTSKFPAISLPVTRDASPASGTSVAPLQVTKSPGKPRPVLDVLMLSPPSQLQPPSRVSSRAPSPSPGLSPTSPYVMVTPTTTSPPSVSPPLRPRNPPTDGFGPRLKLKPSTSFEQLHAQKPSKLSVVPSSDYIVPSPLSSPNVLAYYDVPPPSPPPAGPLPSVPPGANVSAGAFPSSVRGKMPEQSRTAPEAGAFNPPSAPIQRGREAPFPQRPIGGNSGSNVGSGLEARVNVPRYRDLYASPAGGWGNQAEQRRSEKIPNIDVVEPSEDGQSFWEEEESEEMKDVLERFEDTSSEGHHQVGRALESRRSFEVIKQKHARFADFPYEESEAGDDKSIERSTMYSIEGGGDRNSRWSGSIYSRTSFLDPEKSEQTRDRFVQRVEAMLDEEGISRDTFGRVIPPVPRLPEGLRNDAISTPGKSWNRF